ncbi:MAG: bifunctional UDP-N-acetylglucosamine diphosphorylase/glucosamine-1-phosphate N-acetyltransferase GlmU [Porticoccaceae bacterium]|nr:bifunctional UDP-N-acetylglucosamine diphosphorylase/glucosamine-1-phosphate N-acetyltransferase GlmU [Porticoccaceae bacterium]
MAIDVVILAAGKGTRMKSSLPKVLHPLAGKPLLGHVIDTAKTLPDASISVVIGHGSEQISQTFANDDIQWISQHQQLGTGHAVQQAAPFIHDKSVVLVLYGDVPLIAATTLSQLVEKVSDSSMALLTVTMADPTGYGRILRNQQGAVVAIVEEKDATPEQKLIPEVNTGVMALQAEKLKTWLPQLENNNAQGEYYLTDLIAIAAQAGIQIASLQPANSMETQGVNNRSQLHQLERYCQYQQAEKLMAAGVTIADASRFDCRGSLRCGADSFIDINAVFEGDVVLGANVSIGANCTIKDAVIGDNVVIKANTVIEGPVTLEDNVDVGPFARLRPGTVLRKAARIGNFVETKKADIGAGSKVNHLSYIGDATIGDHANIGAGTITCNYDGVNKFQTRIGDGAFIGSNTALVAPVSVGKNATVGAGSTITRDVAADNLAVARARQKNLDGWQRPQKLKKD